MALHESVVRGQNEAIAQLVRTPAFVVVAASLPGLFVANSLANGVGIGIVSAVSIVAMAAAAPLLNKLTGKYSKLPVLLLFAACVAALLGFAVRVAAPVVYQDLGAYIVLASFNAVVMAYVAQSGFAAKPCEKSALGTAVFAAACAFATLVFAGFMNGIFTTGEVFGLTFGPFATSPIAAFGKPTGSLLLLALVATFVQAVATPLPKANEEGGDE